MLSRENGGYGDYDCGCNSIEHKTTSKIVVHKLLALYFISGILAIVLAVVETFLFIELKVKRVA